jgi:hypothetical protein
MRPFDGPVPLMPLVEYVAGNVFGMVLGGAAEAVLR